MKKLILLVGLFLAQTSFSQTMNVPAILNLEGYNTLLDILKQDIGNSEFKDIVQENNNQLTTFRFDAQKEEIINKYQPQIDTCKEDLACLKTTIAKQNAEINAFKTKTNAFNARYGSIIKALNASLAAGALEKAIREIHSGSIIRNTIKVTKPASDIRVINFVSISSDDDHATSLRNVTIQLKGSIINDGSTTNIVKLDDKEPVENRVRIAAFATFISAATQKVPFALDNLAVIKVNTSVLQ